MSIDMYTRVVFATCAVVALMAVCVWLARRFGIGGRVGARGTRRRIEIIEMAPIDKHRRLVLFSRDGVEHLVLTGIGETVVIESGCVSLRPQGIRGPEDVPRPGDVPRLEDAQRPRDARPPGEVAGSAEAHAEVADLIEGEADDRRP
jgi:Flagellar biosynthesis protein, FliO